MSAVTNEAVAVGHVTLDPDAKHDPSRIERLTHREREILRLLSRGLGTRVIAARLCISPTTVRNHVQHILSKLEVHGRLEAILALRGTEG